MKAESEATGVNTAYMVVIEESGTSYACRSKESLLEGMHRLGRRGIPLGCRGGGCGVCKVQIAEGQYHTGVMSRDHVSPQDEAQGRVLACRVFPCSDISLKVIGHLQRKFYPQHQTESSGGH